MLESAASQIAVGLERANYDAEIAAARLDAERSQARAALFSSVTHDLRTPLASIKAAVTSLLQVEVRFDPAQARELLQTVLEETDRLMAAVRFGVKHVILPESNKPDWLEVPAEVRAKPLYTKEN